MKKANKIWLIIMSVISGIGIVLSFISSYFQNKPSTQIIGGADGPTAIYVAKAFFNVSHLICILTIVSITVTIALFIKFKQKK